jgi:hypothetical protein
LRRRSAEIEEEVMVRITSLAGPPELGGAEYLEGLRAAASAAIAYTFEALAQGDHGGTPVPEPLLAQARRAARSGVGLDTVLRRYVAGHGLLSDFLVQEAEGAVAPAELKRLLRRLAATLDCLLSAVTTAYRIEDRRSHRTAEQRRGELVERLLGGEPLDAADLGYRLEAQHVGLVAAGQEAEDLLAALARSFHARLLVIRREEGLVWAWLGRRQAPDPGEVRRFATEVCSPGQFLAIGEPGDGPGGWRLTHRQAAAALPVAQQRGEAVIAYRDVALIAAALQDDLLATSLRRLYLDPLERERDGGAALVETLRGYFAAERNISSTAAALGLTRKTVTRRIQAVEQCVGRSLAECDGELRLALQVNLRGSR